MTNIAILGAAWGDEGKGHIAHHLAPDYDWVVRYSGGANAGHTIYRDGVKYVHNLLPSVDFRVATTKAYLGAGMVIDLEKLRDEVYAAKKSFPGVGSRIYVDKDAFLVLDHHKQEDKEQNGYIGSTNRGIGPAYKDKVSRNGVRVNDLFLRNGRFHDPYYDDFMYQLVGCGVNFVHLLEVPQMKYESILYEGAQGIMLDLNHGTYPYVSCGDATVAGIYSAGFHFAPPVEVYGVAKCYTTKVGEGPFPTEIFGDEAEDLRKRGKEYGATTGRPRRIGWLDLPALKYACQKGGINKLILTKFDILNGMNQVKICDSYKEEPVSSSDFFDASPEYSYIKGWEDANEDEQLIPFIQKIEKTVGCNVSYISRGTDAKDIALW